MMNNDYLLHILGNASNRPVLGAAAAVALSLAGSGLFALVFAFPKAAHLAGVELPWFQVVFIRYAMGFLTILPLAFLRCGRGQSIKSPQAKLHFARAFCGFACLGCLTFAMTRMPYADAVAISYTKGAIILLLAWWFLKEKVTARHWGAVMVSMAGAILVAAPQGLAEGIDPIAFIAFAGAVLMAIEMMILKFSAMREGPVVILLHVNGFAALLTLVPTLLWGVWPPVGDWWYIFLMGPVAIVAQILNIRAFKLADASFLAPFGYSVVVFSALIGVFAFRELMTVSTLTGGLLILLGGLVIALRPSLLLRWIPGRRTVASRSR